MKLVILALCALLVAVCWAEDPLAAPSCICPRIYSPVCASDGETYQNECLFECAKKVQRALTVLRAGTCDNVVENSNPELSNYYP